MSAPYIGRYVKVIGTQKADLNGQQGVASSFDTSTGRYHVQLSGNKIVALKPTNLEPLPGTPPQSSGSGASSGFPGMGGMNAEQFAQAQAQVQILLQKLAGVLPAGISPQNALMGIGLSAAVLIYIMGFLKGFPTVFWIGYCAVYGIPVFTQTRNTSGMVRGLTAGYKAVANQVKIDLSQRTGRAISQKVAIFVTAAFAGLASFFFVTSIISLFMSPVVPSYVGAQSQSYTTTGSSSTGRVTLEEAFKKGYEAANNGEVYSNPYEDVNVNVGGDGSDSVYSSMPFAGTGGSSFGSGTGGSGFDISKVLPLLLVGRMVYTLGKPGPGPWDAQVAIASFQNEPLWKKGLMAIVLVRMFV